MSMTTRPTDRSTAALLRDAADEIERHGWCQLSMWAEGPGPAAAAHASEVSHARPDPGGTACCPVGALDRVNRRDPRQGAVPRAARAVVRDVLGIPVDDDRLAAVELAYWNDRPTRTAGEVTSALREAAHRLDGREAAV